MNISDIIKVIGGRLVSSEDNVNVTLEVKYAFSSDLMSDVLTIDADKLLLITGLNNLQTIRTAEVAEISHIVFVRNKKVSEEMKLLAKENNMVLIECSGSMYRVSGELFSAGLLPVY